MTLVPRIVTPTVSTAKLIDKEAAKKYAGIDHDDDDALVGTLIATAFAWLQPPAGCLAFSISAQTLRLDLPCWPLAGLCLPCGPIRSISSIKYYDAANAEQTLDAGKYFLDDDDLIWTLNTFDAPALYQSRPRAVRIEYVAGMADAEAAASTLPMAMTRIVKQLYDNRDELVAGVTFDPAAFGVDALILPYRFR